MKGVCSYITEVFMKLKDGHACIKGYYKIC